MSDYRRRGNSSRFVIKMRKQPIRSKRKNKRCRPLIANKQVEQVMPSTCDTSMEGDRHQHDVTGSGIEYVNQYVTNTSQTDMQAAIHKGDYAIIIIILIILIIMAVI